MDQKRQRANMAKQQLDTDKRKLKTFLIMKPVIIRDIKKKLLSQKLKIREKKQFCKRTVVLAKLLEITRHLSQSFLKKKELHDL